MAFQSPYQPSILGNTKISSTYCQHAHFFAMQSGFGDHQTLGTNNPFIPTKFEVIDNDSSAFLYNHSQIEEIFDGMTIAEYDAIADLFLSPVGRSYSTIQSILSRLASAAGVRPLTEEAVWVICQNLTPKFRQKFRPTILVRERVWDVTVTSVSIATDYKVGKPVSNMVSVIIWMEDTIVGAGLVRVEEIIQEVGIGLFETITSQRTQDPYSQGGILWNLPYLIRGSKQVLAAIDPACQKLGIQTESVSETGEAINEVMEKIQVDWNHNMPTEAKSIAQWNLIFDTYLATTVGLGPKNQTEHQQYLWRNHPKLSLDPGTIFPELRLLIPSYPVAVQENGVIYHNQIRYIDPLLSLWEGEDLTLRPSPSSFQRGWVYTNNEIICELKPPYENK